MIRCRLRRAQQCPSRTFGACELEKKEKKMRWFNILEYRIGRHFFSVSKEQMSVWESYFNGVDECYKYCHSPYTIPEWYFKFSKHFMFDARCCTMTIANQLKAKQSNLRTYVYVLFNIHSLLHDSTMSSTIENWHVQRFKSACSWSRCTAQRNTKKMVIE